MNLKEQAAALTDYWSPKVVGQVNDQYVKVAKLKGEFAWHEHDGEDELFLVLDGTLHIQYDDHTAVLQTGDMHIVKKGTLHNPVCIDECLVALVETVTTLHTGNRVTDKTVSVEEQARAFNAKG